MMNNREFNNPSRMCRDEGPNQMQGWFKHSSNKNSFEQPYYEYQNNLQTPSSSNYDRDTGFSNNRGNFSGGMNFDSQMDNNRRSDQDFLHLGMDFDPKNERNDAGGRYQHERNRGNAFDDDRNQRSSSSNDRNRNQNSNSDVCDLDSYSSNENYRSSMKSDRNDDRNRGNSSRARSNNSNNQNCNKNSSRYFSENANTNESSLNPIRAFVRKPFPNDLGGDFISFSNPQNPNVQQLKQLQNNKPKPRGNKSLVRLMKTNDFNKNFTISRRSSDGTTTYNCKLCHLSNLPEMNLETHMTGKRHKHHLKKLVTNEITGKVNDEKMRQFKSVARPARVYHHIPKFDTVIKDINHPLIALTYTVEILDPSLREPSYVCVLCDKRCDPRTTIKHLVSQNHRMNYLEKHFPRLISTLHSQRRFNEDMDYRQIILVNVSSVIESRFGRPSSAFIYDGTDYENTKEVIFENVKRKNHVSEQDIPNSVDFLLQGISLNNENWEAQNPPKESTAEQPKIETHFDGISLSKNITDGKRKRKITQKVMDDYHAAVDEATNELEKKLYTYERDPESHPFYGKEWQLFWNRKVDEMKGADPKNCNFHDEWCEFFVQRMRELHKQEVEWKTEQIRRKFGLTIDDLREEKEEKRAKIDENPFIDRKGRFNIDDEDSDDESDEDYQEEPKFGPRTPKDVLYVKEKKIFDEFMKNFEKNSEAHHSKTTTPQIPTNSTTLISTCRLLLALEGELGLLAPKVLDLLSKSLACEREKPKSSDELLLDYENLNLVETVKEKIIGLQSAGLIPSNKTQVVTKAINEVDSLIEKHEIMLKIKKSLRDMGKNEASAEEIEMLLHMFKSKETGK